MDANGIMTMTVDDAGAFGPATLGRMFLSDGGAETGNALAEDVATGLNFNYEFTTIPAPGAMALLGLGGLVATRRRR